MNSIHHNVIVIGAGPAGVMAAVQLVRLRRHVALLEPAAVGGLLREASLVENFPGFPDGIEGKALASQLARHLARLGIEPIREAAAEVRWEDGAFAVRTEGRILRSPSLVVASGTSPRELPISVPAQVRDRVHTGIAGLGRLAGARIAIVGGGDAAFDYALRLAGANVILLFHRSRPRCLELLLERALSCQRIRLVEGAEVWRVDASERGLRIGFGVGGQEEMEEVDHLLFAIGRIPNDGFLQMGPMMDELIQQGRLHFVGDIKNGQRRQAAIAAGDGLVAAMTIAEKERTWR